MNSRFLEPASTRPMKRRRPRLAFITPVHLLRFAIFVIAILAHPAWGQSTQTLRIYLARHGQTDWNAERRIQGSTDTALNSTGLKQATILTERLKGVRLDMVYCSNLRRSRDTAQIARGTAPITSIAGLNERGVGKFEGKWLERTKDPATMEEFPKRSRDPDDELDGGESWNQFDARVGAAFAEIRSQHSSGAILIVGHAGTNQMILRKIFNLGLEQSLSIKQGNDELYLIEMDDANRPRIWKLISEANLNEL